MYCSLHSSMPHSLGIVELVSFKMHVRTCHKVVPTIYYGHSNPRFFKEMKAMRKYHVARSQILSFIQRVQVSQCVCFASMTWINLTVWVLGHSRPGERPTKCKLHCLFLTYRVFMEISVTVVKDTPLSKHLKL